MADYLRDIWPDCSPPEASMPGKDLRNTPGFAFEIKARSRFEPLAFVRQASKNALLDEKPLVVVRMTGQGEASIGSWLAFTPLLHMRDLIREAGYSSLGRGDPATNPQAHSLGLGSGLVEPYELGRSLSEATRTAIFRTLGLRPGDREMEILRGEST